MSRINKVNPDHYKVAGRLSPDDLARERSKQSEMKPAGLRRSRRQAQPPWTANERADIPANERADVPTPTAAEARRPTASGAPETPQKERRRSAKSPGRG